MDEEQGGKRMNREMYKRDEKLYCFVRALVCV